MRPDATVDFLIIGAGFSGLVLAERLSRHGWKCVVADQRGHIGGNAYDEYDAAGVLVHRYGPHYFRTNSPAVVAYLSQFTGWTPVEYEIKSHARGRYWSFPVNLNTFEEWKGGPATSAEFEQWLEQNRIPIAHPANSEESVLSRMGREFYELFFQGYTWKQWDMDPRQLAASVCARIPLRTNRDNRYLDASFQALPDKGYTAMFGGMLARSPGVEVHLGIEASEARARWRHRHLFHSGAIDEFYQYRFGPLPYRSLRFEAESFTAAELHARLPESGKEGFWQPALQVNHPSRDVPFTRTVELKHATRQAVDASTVIREFPQAWEPGRDRHYPVPTDASSALYRKYRALAARETDVTFLGRLGTYRYYNMDQVVARALAVADSWTKRHPHPARNTPP